MRRHLLLGITGLAGSGKDTTADVLVQEHGFVKVALADPLKRIARDVYDFTDTQLWGPSSARNAPDRRYPRTEAARAFAKQCVELLDETFLRAVIKEFGETAGKHFLTPREVLQKIGTECGRECYENTWIDKAVRTAEALLSSNGDACYDAQRGLYHPKETRDRAKGVAIPDVRFKNEMTAIREAGGLLLRVKRTTSGLKGGFELHRSEAEQLEVPDSYFDFVAHNDGPLEELPQRVAEMLSSLRERLATGT